MDSWAPFSWSQDLLHPLSHSPDTAKSPLWTLAGQLRRVRRQDAVQCWRWESRGLGCKWCPWDLHKHSLRLTALWAHMLPGKLLQTWSLHYVLTLVDVGKFWEEFCDFSALKTLIVEHIRRNCTNNLGEDSLWLQLLPDPAFSQPLIWAMEESGEGNIWILISMNFSGKRAIDFDIEFQFFPIWLHFRH